MAATQRYRPTPTDGFPTPTSHTQAETEAVLREHLPSHLASPSLSSSASTTGDAPANSPSPSSATAASSTQTKPAPADPQLKKQAHMQFLVKHLVNGFPARYLSQDASQPWLLFWTLQAFSVLQVGMDPQNGQRIIDKVLTWQHPVDGGFGGGPGQAPHLLPTYAAVCCLGIVGRAGDKGGWDQVDREKMYAFFMSLKQPDGSFTVARGGEVDVRGIYCLLAVATLLDLLTPELVAGTPAFLASCQTYEGGFASGSCFSGTLGSMFRAAASGNPWSDDVLNAEVLKEGLHAAPIGTGASADAGRGLGGTPRARPALGEAHGGYTFCALASWVLLQPFVGGQKGVLNANVVPPPSESAPTPSSTGPPPNTTGQTQTAQGVDQARIDVPALLRWLTSMQGSAAELGGFRGRTNKLVDGCYSWWCGGAFALLEALGVGGMQNAPDADLDLSEKTKAKATVTGGVGPEVGAIGAGESDGKGEGEGEGEVLQVLKESDSGDVWDEVDDGLYNRTALQEYILYAGQHPAGGLRDKPPKNADAYHTLYCLSGLSSAQHHVFPSHPRRAQVEEAWRGDGRDSPTENERRKSVFSALLSWTEEEGTSIIVGGPGNRVNATHPLTNLTITHTEAMAAHFYAQRVPARARPAVRKV